MNSNPKRLALGLSAVLALIGTAHAEEPVHQATNDERPNLAPEAAEASPLRDWKLEERLESRELREQPLLPGSIGSPRERALRAAKVKANAGALLVAFGSASIAASLAYGGFAYFLCGVADGTPSSGGCVPMRGIPIGLGVAGAVSVSGGIALLAMSGKQKERARVLPSLVSDGRTSAVVTLSGRF